ncbi:PTS sugar transporter subunit IIC, partial [Weissella soli]
GTSASAGFGFSGLLGPIAAITTGSTLIEVIMIFVVVPVILAFTVKYIFISLTNLVKPSDLKLPELS